MGRGGKRIRRLARYHWSSGDAGEGYCSNICEADTEGRCEDCPYRKDAPATPAGKAVWKVVRDCGMQLRVGGMGRPFALDFGAVMAVGTARGVDLMLLSEILPSIEGSILIGRDGQSTLEDDHGGE